MINSQNITAIMTLLFVLILAGPGIANAADTQVSVTIAFCGAAGGFYFFLSLTSGFIHDWQFATGNPALFNYSPDGWRIAWPQLFLKQINHSSCAPYLELVKVRF
ncbi:MAG: hypothetical protein JRG97_01070 [Deltaproteobacteria bacterium]|nr:hypothetical protein [Deltaproteobacteria bacterium]MBW2052612.1 hypothetical protein [Deltaproteobacteria bacterium]MBW2139646.1 hypothetical protein [Deltaproteobacteria bacterium]MBW2322141.1 hypothetical protein [Deltaproteobacteria bacterium]